MGSALMKAVIKRCHKQRELGNQQGLHREVSGPDQDVCWASHSAAV